MAVCVVNNMYFDWVHCSLTKESRLSGICVEPGILTTYIEKHTKTVSFVWHRRIYIQHKKAFVVIYLYRWSIIYSIYFVKTLSLLLNVLNTNPVMTKLITFVTSLYGILALARFLTRFKHLYIPLPLYYNIILNALSL